MKDKRKSHSKVLDMVEEDLHAIGKVKDVSLSIKKFNVPGTHDWTLINTIDR